MIKIVFMGTPAFSVPILESLVSANYEVLAVVTQPDRPVGRKKILTPPPVKEAAIRLNLPVLQPEKIAGSSEMAEIIALEPDLIVTAAFGQFLPTTLLEAPRLGAINVHASLLPKYRGGAPVHYAVMNGDQESGVTIMEMVKEMDAGDILAQKAIPIEDADNVGTMFEKLSLVGRDLLLETLPTLIAGEIKPIPQDPELVTYSPTISREEEQIDWSKTATQIHCKVRGLCPWPVAYTKCEDVRWKLWDVAVSEEKTTATPGTITERNKKDLKIACGGGTVLTIKQLQPAGKGKLTAAEFLNGVGRHLEIGDHLG